MRKLDQMAEEMAEQERFSMLRRLPFFKDFTYPEIYEILQAGFQLEIPRMFAALFLITVAGLALFLVMVALSRLALCSWHDSAVEREA